MTPLEIKMFILWLALSFGPQSGLQTGPLHGQSLSLRTMAFTPQNIIQSY